MSVCNSPECIHLDPDTKCFCSCGGAHHGAHHPKIQERLRAEEAERQEALRWQQQAAEAERVRLETEKARAKAGAGTISDITVSAVNRLLGRVSPVRKEVTPQPQSAPRMIAVDAEENALEPVAEREALHAYRR